MVLECSRCLRSLRLFVAPISAAVVFLARLVLLEPLSRPFFFAATIGAVSRTDSLFCSDCPGLLTGLVDLEEMVNMDVLVDGVSNSFEETSMPAR